ncbi:MAG: hypothetical protein WCG26_05030 [Chloroflexales bacterium]
MEHTPSERPSRRREGGGCGRRLGALLFSVCLLVLIYNYALKPMLSRAIADQLAGPINPLPTLMPVGAAPPAALPTGVPSSLVPASAAAAMAQAAALLPSAVAALPSGELAISEGQINALIAARPNAIAPLERASISFADGSAVADIGAYGLSSTATVALTVQDGRLVVTSARINGPLALLVSGDTLARALADRLNAELGAQGRRIDSLQIEAGQLMLVMR